MSVSVGPKAVPREAGDSFPAEPIVLFDGVCNFCNAAIMFIVDHERAPTLRFVALQSDIAQSLLERAFGAEQTKLLKNGATGDGDPDTMVLIEGEKGFTRSTAGLRIATYLRAPWSWLYALILVPRPLRDLVYRFIVKNRYRWFGKSETCRVPSPELRKRFL